MAGCDIQKNVNETHNFYVENLLDVRRKNHGTVVHSKIHYINGTSTTTSSLFNSLNRTESLATKSYHQQKQQQQQENNTKLQNRQQPNDLSSQGFRHPKTNPTYWKELCSNIRSGRLSDWITDHCCRDSVSTILGEPNPELADLIEKGIVSRLWPKTKCVETIVTGIMAQYIPALEFYSDKLYLFPKKYGSKYLRESTTEEDVLKALDRATVVLESSDLMLTGFTCFGDVSTVPGHYVFNLKLKAKVNNDTNVLLLDEKVLVEYCCVMEESLSSFYRSLRRKDGPIGPLEVRVVQQGTFDSLMEFFVTRGASITQYKTPVCINSVEALKVLEDKILARCRVGDVLQVTGFYNKSPQFRFVRRKNTVLSIYVEPTVVLESSDLILTGFTCYADISTLPGHYVFYLELKDKVNNGTNESLSSLYKLLRGNDEWIGALEIRVVQQGTFDSLMEFFVSRGASISQYKTPICINSAEALKVLEDKVLARFFSDKSPPT
uniref:Uncharacterized protein n=1 Tax=Brassica oleracea var. oleracea TaxID=109376 RepID=A0A0D3DY47_BRAOL